MSGPGPVRSPARRVPRAGPRGASAPLAVFAAAYAACLLLAPDPRWALGGIAAAAAGAGAIVAVDRLRAPRARVPSRAGAASIQLTAAAQGVALVVALVVALTAGSWWAVLPVLLTAVCVHVAALLIALRRSADVAALVVVLAAAIVAWSLSPTSMREAWTLGGGAAAGMCIGYLIVLRLPRRRVAAAGTPRADLPVGAADGASASSGQ
ncbi:hypothetical protein [Clavibacter capsici]|uniref:Uncharacterized protein n=1 Tax=Clavibacter capsici TaxID=1874630 RepID=A0AAE6XSR7_9MICO|nr:hypothetical protein [Clavibacter capsici]QIS39777.1 hypothetical protein GW572_11760 [Clavibacter capsici]QIS45636.1 hypothetical protein GW570_11335 [Clavibacter capsici]